MITDTIKTLFAAGNLPEILNQFQILMEDRARVRFENDGLKHEIRRLAVAFAQITEPATGRKISDTETRTPKPKSASPSPSPTSVSASPVRKPIPAPKSPKPSKDPLDLDL